MSQTQARNTQLLRDVADDSVRSIGITAVLLTLGRSKLAPQVVNSNQ